MHILSIRLQLSLAEGLECLQVDDWAAYSAYVRSQHPPDLPFFISGHSMGALTSLLVVLQDQSAWQGLVCCSATVDVEWTWFLRYDPLYSLQS